MEEQRAEQGGEHQLHASGQRHGAGHAQIVEGLDLQYLRDAPRDAVDGRGRDQRPRPVDRVEDQHHDTEQQRGEHHAHLLVGGGAADLLHDNALKTPAECGDQGQEDRPHVRILSSRRHDTHPRLS